MTVPEDFADRLEQRFNGRFRIRWSDVEGRYLIEQRIRRGIAEGGMPKGEYRNRRQRRARYEDRVRAQDGYILTCVVTAGSTAFCTRCDAPMPSRLHMFTISSCPECARQGIEQPVQAGFFPLDDRLLLELEKADPLKGGVDRIANDITVSNDQLEIEREADFIRPIDAAARDRYRRLLGIPFSAGTKVFSGSEGPGTR